MKIIKSIFLHKHSLIWIIVTIVMIAVMITAGIMASNFSGVISLAMGGDRAVKVESDENAVVFYERATESKEQALQNAFSLTTEVSEEGTVLLKNENALPLKANANVSVFGKNSVSLVYGGSGSGGGDKEAVKLRKTIFDSLTEAGIGYNSTLKEFYSDNGKSGAERGNGPTKLDPDAGAVKAIATGETPQSSYTAHNIPDSYSGYKDAAIIVFSRVGGEGFDLPMAASNGAKHYLSLDNNEKDLLAHVKTAGFEKVIVVLNTLNVIETGFLDEYGVDGCLWIGGPGTTGIMALGRILNGSVTPSGHTTDTWAADFTKDPTWNNFSERNIEKGDSYYNTVAKRDTTEFFVNYEESVYVGYRYYETRAYEEKKKSGNDSWYNENVIFPLGYGQSYTNFKWEVTDKSSVENKSIVKDGMYTVKVKVTNTGDYKGKDVVQMYAKLSDYNPGGLERAYEVLCAFKKTPMLYPASQSNGTDKPNSCEVEMTFNPYDIASYDYLGKSGFKGYVIEAGTDYALHINTDAHTNKFSIPFKVDKDITYREDPKTGNQVVNRYTEQTDSAFNSDTMIKDSLMSRSDLSALPDAPVSEDRNVNQAFLNLLKDVTHNNSDAGNYTMPSQGLAATTDLIALLKHDDKTKVWYAPYGNQDEKWKESYDDQDEKWDAVLNAITVKEMCALVSEGGFKSNHIESINKPETLESDGPVGWCNFIEASGDTWKGNNAYTSQVVISATWNFDLAKKMGESVGEEALWGAVKTDGRTYSGWYAPGVNIHRSPFGGRNFEYYSEDSYLTGMIASAVVQGCQSKGVYTYIKHFALNEQETHRGGGCSWVTEQAMREIYLKPFEMTVKVGGTRAMMTSFNRIGTRWTGGDYRLLTEILRGEWGFRGTVICDYNTGAAYMNFRQMIYAGGDLSLATDKSGYWNDALSTIQKSAADVTVLRMATKNILYTVANSNAMNGLNYVYKMAIWKIVLIVVMSVIAAGLVVWGFFAIKGAFKNKEKD